ncbi:hypothetical protein MRX96_032181 [Rhipicephalus microplus]
MAWCPGETIFVSTKSFVRGLAMKLAESPLNRLPEEPCCLHRSTSAGVMGVYVIASHAYLLFSVCLRALSRPLGIDQGRSGLRLRHITRARSLQSIDVSHGAQCEAKGASSHRFVLVRAYSSGMRVLGTTVACRR